MATTTAELLESTPHRQAPEGKLARLFSSRGRIGVRTYLTRTLLGVVPVFAALFMIGLAVNTAESRAADGLILSEQLVMVLSAAIIFVSVFYLIMMGVRRLHDLEMHGWFYLVSMVPFVGSFFSLYMTFAPGKPESNKYGDFYAPSLFDKFVGGLLIALCALCVVAFLVVTVLDLAS